MRFEGVGFRDNVYSYMTKTSAFLVVAICFPLVTFCQKNRFKQLPTFGVHFVLNDFKTAANIRFSSLSATLREGKFGKIRDMSPGIALNYMQGFAGNFDLTSTLAASFLDYPKHDTLYSGEKKLLLEGDVSIRAKLFGSGYWVSPYLQIGAGISKYKSNWGAFIPAGAGLQVNLTRELFLMVNAQYRLPATPNTVSRHFYYSLGVAGIFGRNVKVRPKQEAATGIPINPPTDRDGDGILDSADVCPDQPGMAMFRGCSDKDNDSIPDKDDVCPLVFGVRRYNGCPVPDLDKDGFNDEVDKCISVPGVAKYEGCPAPDRDNDGIEDDADKCPDIPAATAGSGCPEEVKDNLRVAVEKAARNILFATDSYRILPSSFNSLNVVAEILNDNPELKLEIEGHTDNTGSLESNEQLSKARARAVNDYLVKRGIKQSRLIFAGFGERMPIAENSTDTGRAKNRRVEMKLRY
jgi:OmpA-OmpF porin, OOP family